MKPSYEIVECAKCGSELGVPRADWCLEHHADGSHTAHPQHSNCAVCGRERTADDRDYSPLQVIHGRPLGWYSGDDGEICPEDFAKLMGRADA